MASDFFATDCCLLYNAKLSNYFGFPFGGSAAVSSFQVTVGGLRKFKRHEPIPLTVSTEFLFEDAGESGWAGGDPREGVKLVDTEHGHLVRGLRRTLARRDAGDCRGRRRRAARLGPAPALPDGMRETIPAEKAVRPGPGELKVHHLTHRQCYKRSLDVSEICDFSRPGTYLVQLIYENGWIASERKGEWPGRFRSPVFEVTMPGGADAAEVAVNWGDGQSGGSDTQTFYYAVPTCFSVFHYYLLNDAMGAATQTDNVTVTVTANDGPTATTNLTATIVNVAPTVAIVVENPPAGGLGSVPSSQTFTVDALALRSGAGVGRGRAVQLSMVRQGRRHRDRFECHRDGGRCSCGPGLGDGHGRAWGSRIRGDIAAPDRPGGEHFGDRYRHEPDGFGRNDAEFDIHIDAGTAGPDAQMTFSYQYGGPVGRGDGLHLHLRPSGGDALGGGLWQSPATGSPTYGLPVATTPGIYDGSTATVMVPLSNPYMCQLAVGTAEATATVRASSASK